jgi:hypothetical protein
MLRRSYIDLLLVLSIAVCVRQCVSSDDLGYARNALQTAPESAQKAAAYFPPGLFNGIDYYMAEFLSRAGEPSLLASARDSGTLSFRVSSMGFVPRYTSAVRLSLNADGSGTIVASREAGAAPVLRQSQDTMPAPDVKRFLQIVEQAKFWTMPSMADDHKGKGIPDKAYKMDESVWIFEGVRNREYHVVSRRGLESRQFKEMVTFLSKYLAQLDGSPAGS